MMLWLNIFSCEVPTHSHLTPGKWTLKVGQWSKIKDDRAPDLTYGMFEQWHGACRDGSRQLRQQYAMCVIEKAGTPSMARSWHIGGASSSRSRQVWEDCTTGQHCRQERHSGIPDSWPSQEGSLPWGESIRRRGKEAVRSNS